MIKEEYFNFLSKFEYEFMYADNDVLLGILPDEMKRLIDIYNEIFKAREIYNGCSKCYLNIVKRLSLKYKEEINARKIKAEETKTDDDFSFEIYGQEETRKKRVRKRKDEKE